MWAAGTVAAAVYNTNRSNASDPVANASDFVPKSLSEMSQPIDEIPQPEPEIEALAAFFGTRKESAKAALVPDK